MIAHRRLTRRPIAVTDLSLGCSQLGNLYEEVSGDTSRATIDAAWELGVRYFDTAPHYGLGLSERRLGSALRSRQRDEFVVSTKVGRLLKPSSDSTGQDTEGFVVPATHRRVWDFSRDGVRRSIADSLERLGLDRFDIAYLHDPDDYMAAAIATGYPALDELRAEGVVTAIGAGMNSSRLLAELIRETDLDVVMLAGRYTLLEQDSLDDLLPLCERQGVAIVAAGTFNSGLLARPRPDATSCFNYTAAPPELVARALAIAQVCERHGSTLPAAALAFPLAHPAVVSVCVGARSPEQIERNAQLREAWIAPELWAALQAEGLLRDDAPVPVPSEPRRS